MLKKARLKAQHKERSIEGMKKAQQLKDKESQGKIYLFNLYLVS